MRVAERLRTYEHIMTIMMMTVHRLGNLTTSLQCINEAIFILNDVGLIWLEGSCCPGPNPPFLVTTYEFEKNATSNGYRWNVMVVLSPSL